MGWALEWTSQCPLPMGCGPLQVDYLLNSQEFTHMIMLDADAALVRHQVSESGGSHFCCFGR